VKCAGGSGRDLPGKNKTQKRMIMRTEREEEKRQRGRPSLIFSE